MDVIADHDVGEFPTGLKILLVDDDRTCLVVMEKMLRKLSYQVTKCQHGKDALALLREDRNRFDIVICDLHMPDIDGLELSEIIELETNLPVVMMSSDDRQEVVMKGIIKGACDYLVKPVPMESLRLIWQHVVRKKKGQFQQPGFGDDINVNVNELLKHTNDAAANNQMVTIVDKSSSLQRLKQKIEDASNDGESSDDVTTAKKPRVVWSQELHELFVAAVDKLGRDKAVPKKILELMQAMDVNASCLTRANVASHLQKYRMHIQKGVARSNGNIEDINAHHRNLQFHPSLTTSYQPPLQNHVYGGNNFFDSNIVSKSSRCSRTEVSMYELSRSNLLYQNDFLPRGDYVSISNEENPYGNVGNGTELFSGPAELIYGPSVFVEYVPDIIPGPF